MSGLLEEIYELDKSNPRLAVDRIVDYLDDLQNAGQFDECETFLRAACPSRLSPPAVVAVLVITLAASGRFIDARRSFYQRALNELGPIHGVARMEKVLGKYHR